MFLDNLPESSEVGVVRHAFKHHGDGAVCQRAVDNVRVPGNPADIRGAPVDIAFVVVKNLLVRVGCINEVSAGGVQHPFRFARGAGGVEDEKRFFGIHGFRFAFGVGGCHGLVPPDIACVVKVHRVAGALHDDNLLNGGTFGDGRVGVRFHRDVTARPSHRGILRYQHFACRVVNPVAEGFRRERAENDGVNGPDAGAREHRNC